MSRLVFVPALLVAACGTGNPSDTGSTLGGRASVGGSSANAGATSGGNSTSSGGNSTASGGNSTSSGGTAPASGGSSGHSSGGTGLADATGGRAGSGPVDHGQPGVWENVTPPGVDLTSDFGAQDVLADPVRPSDLYVGFCKDGIYRSTDFGTSWTKVSTGTNGSVLATGRPWSSVIQNDAGRDPATSPAIYTTNGYGSSLGVFKSNDWGKNWTQYFAGNDVSGLDMDPYDSQHILVGRHEAVGIAETTDGGATWKSIATTSGTGIAPHFIDTGAAGTTRKTWILIPTMDTGTSTLTTDAGATFVQVGGIAHAHTGNQLFNAGAGVAYAPGRGGVFRTTNSGSSWSKAYPDSAYGWAAGVIGTPSMLYAWDDGANATGIGEAHMYKATRASGTDWVYVPSPSGMNNGPLKAAVTFDGTHYVIVGGNWNAGIWRYVEP